MRQIISSQRVQWTFTRIQSQDRLGGGGELIVQETARPLLGGIFFFFFIQHNIKDIIRARLSADWHAQKASSLGNTWCIWQVNGRHDKLPKVAGQQQLFGLGCFFVSNLLTSAGLWPLFCLWFLRQNFCADNLPPAAGWWPVFGPMTVTCQPLQVTGRFSELRKRISVTCALLQVYGRFSDFI